MCRGEAPELLPDLELDPRTFEVETWNAKDSVEYDHMVQCDGKCKRYASPQAAAAWRPPTPHHAIPHHATSHPHHTQPHFTAPRHSI